MNDRYRQKRKVLRRWVHSARHSDGPLMPPMLAAELFNVLAETVRRDYERSKIEPPMMWSEPIPQLVMYGTIDTEVEL